MAYTRFKALDLLHSREIPKLDIKKRKTSEFYGENVFNGRTMQEYLSKEAYEHIVTATSTGSKIDRKGFRLRNARGKRLLFGGKV